MAGVELRGVEMVYPEGTRAVRDFDLAIEEGELLVLLGPSGCGKSTVLRLIAGLETPTAGEILIDGVDVVGRRPRERNVAMVFQSYALYPHMTVRTNLEFPLRMRGTGRAERAARVEEVARLLELEPLLDKRPGRLSGGQQQRVAMGRALVREPSVFLLDEPLSNLDAKLRARLRTEIGALQARVGVTTVYVTHDQVEAMTLGRRVAVLREGRVRQVGTGQQLYDAPADTFVASFIGQPGMNLFRARTGEGVLELSDERMALHWGAGVPAGGTDVIAGVRPEALRLTRASDGDGRLRGRVEAVEELGPERILWVACDLDVVRPEDGTPGEADGMEPIAARVAAASGPRPGDAVELSFDPGALRLFDAEGRALGGVGTAAP